MISKEQAKQEIKNIIEDFERNREYYQRTDEGNIESKLLEPLFYALGWNKHDFEKREKVRRKEGRGVSDYAFKISDRIVFFLEAKKVSVNLDKHKETWKQAISYALSKRVPFAVLSNFEKLKIFCVEQENALSNQFRDLNYREFLTRFDDLWLLSKESFKNNAILDIATREQRLKKRVSIDTELLEDLIFVSKLIVNNIEKRYPRKYELTEKEAIAQRILNRLIFIRNAEDKFINKDKNGNDIEILKEIATYPENRIYNKLKEVFSKYNEVYDSDLFAISYDNDADKISLDGSIIKKLIPHLYESKKREYIYNFDWIDADIMGQVYEQYLGNILQQAKSGVSRLKGGQAHRKEQGTYYTPTYIVDYIVRNTLGEILKKKKNDVSKIRVLDPACGSGSFLIKAFDILDEYYRKKSDYSQKTLGFDGTTYSTKERIVKNNIFGVDVDEKAVEIAQLNLLLKIAEMGHRLPMLEKNIKRGNSLIADETIAGLRAFKWKEQFGEIMNDLGFDIIIGNPPYVFGGGSGISKLEKEFFKKNYYSAKRKLNLFSLFIERSINLLKNGGILGFILPNTLLRVTSYEEIRKLILDKTKILKIVNLEAGVFEGVTASTIIIILQKEESKESIKKNKIKIFNDIQEKFELKPQTDFSNNLHIFDIFSSVASDKLIEKISENSIKLGSISKEMIFGVVITKNKDEIISNKKLDSRYKKFLEGRDIDRYKIKFSNKYLLYDKSKLHRARTPEIFEAKEKILVQRISGGKKPLKAAYDNQKFYNKESINNIILSDNRFNIKYILALLNSDLINWFYSKKFTNISTLTVNVSKAYLSNIPIKNIPLSKQKPIIELVEKIISFNRRLNEIGEKETYEKLKIKEEINRIDKKINELVYKIYSITEKEKKIIDESLR